MEKAAEAFRTISEVANELDVPKHVLRFWEGKFPQVKPMKRGGGRRFYRPEDVDLLKGIRRLLYDEGYTIKGVQKVLRDQGVDHVKTHWSKLNGAAGKGRASHATAGEQAPVRTGSHGSGRGLRDGHANGSTAPFRVSRSQARRLRDALVALESCRSLLAEDG